MPPQCLLPLCKLAGLRVPMDYPAVFDPDPALRRCRVGFKLWLMGTEILILCIYIEHVSQNEYSKIFYKAGEISREICPKVTQQVSGGNRVRGTCLSALCLGH